ncbi:MAG TPA: ATP-binding protein [Gemmataceae bacterium]|nr:ATP-binding protein [Gemmataceae bacterium]
MRAPAVAEAATHLSWLSPSAASLVALTRSPTATSWAEVRSDPGCVLHIVRHASAILVSPTLSFFPSLLHDAAVLEAALRHLEQPHPSCIDWTQAALLPIYETCLAYARLSAHLAEQTGRADPDNAWVAGLLAPLGWLAACAVDSPSVTAVKLQMDSQSEPVDLQSAIGNLQSKVWGLDQSAIARRLARRWRLPAWLAATCGHLGLAAPTAQSIGADPELFRIVQLAVGLVQRVETGLGLPVGESVESNAAALEMSTPELETLEAKARATCPSATGVWQRPDTVPLLRDLLRLAAENRRLAESPMVERLEAAADQLQRALEEQRASEARRLREQKLAALAEFAAGAGHEINNPLAVISGQAQYLLKQLHIAGCKFQIGPEESATAETVAANQGPGTAIGDLQSSICNSQEAIIKQTQRIHEILNELMYFARPPKPHEQSVDVGILVQDVVAALADFATERRVRITCSPPDAGVIASVDPGQIRMALTCLLRNAVQAAAPDGWAGIRLESPMSHSVQILVEDSGEGPTERQREHLFDPFYSGRQAGRGRGLGLPTAWRLARENGGDVYFDEVAGGPTRFVLTLPRAVPIRSSPAVEAADNIQGNGWNGGQIVDPSPESLSRILSNESLPSSEP